MCYDEADRSLVDNTLVNFDTLFHCVLINNFLQLLSAFIAWITYTCPCTKPANNNAESDRGKKQKKQET